MTRGGEAPRRVPPIKAWTSPSAVLAALGFAMTVYGSYLTFQKDVGQRIAVIETQIKGLERDVAWLRQEQQQKRKGEGGE